MPPQKNIAGRSTVRIVWATMARVEPREFIKVRRADSVIAHPRLNQSQDGAKNPAETQQRQPAADGFVYQRTTGIQLGLDYRLSVTMDGLRLPPAPVNFFLQRF
jgi:hypothetical protein